MENNIGALTKQIVSSANFDLDKGKVLTLVLEKLEQGVAIDFYTFGVFVN